MPAASQVSVQRRTNRREKSSHALRDIGRIVRASKRLDQGAADHHGIGKAGNGFRARRIANAETNRHRRLGARADVRNTLGNIAGTQVTRAGDAGKLHVVQKATRVGAEFLEAVRCRRRRGEANLLQTRVN